jgi:DNA (cytosine-5)-methyltransferase 1
MKVKLFSFFSGTGFLDLGFENSGFSVAFVNEYLPAFLDSYKFSRQALNLDAPEHGYYGGSITDFAENATLARKLEELIKESRRDGSLIGFIGGPPCPDFSVGGKNRGRHGENGKLSQTYAHLICEQKPDFFLFENVKGLWLTKRHRKFYEELQVDLQNAGYKTSDRLINAVEFGVPQDRERIIMVGFRDTVSERNGHPFDDKSKGFFPWSKFTKYRSNDVFSKPWPTAQPFEAESKVPMPTGLPAELTVEYWFRKNDVDTHPNAEHCFKPRAGLARFESVAEGDDSRKSFKRLHRWRYSPTACYGNNEVHLHPYRARRISVAEALAVQSLPKGFQLPPDMSLSTMFKTVGNGVPYLAAKGLARTIHSFLQGEHDQTDGIRHSSGNSKLVQEPGIQLHLAQNPH